MQLWHAVDVKVYLVQHGKALSKEQDPDRPLSAQGCIEVTQVAELLRKASVAVAAVQHSGKTRAKQTAELLAAAVGEPPVSARDGLAPNDPVEGLVKESAGWHEDTMVVGHMPFMRKVAAMLLVGRDGPTVVSFTPGGVTCLVRDDDVGWSVAWMVVPDLLG